MIATRMQRLKGSAGLRAELTVKKYDKMRSVCNRCIFSRDNADNIGYDLVNHLMLCVPLGSLDSPWIWDVCASQSTGIHTVSLIHYNIVITVEV